MLRMSVGVASPARLGCARQLPCGRESCVGPAQLRAKKPSAADSDGTPAGRIAAWRNHGSPPLEPLQSMAPLANLGEDAASVGGSFSR